METQKNNGMCRCCASEGTFKDVKSSYQWMGEEEIYADMLRECLDISLCADVSGEVEGGICEVCITQLRNASNFKKQVLHTEEQFKQRIQDKLFKNEIVKVELSPQHEEDSDNDNVLDSTLDDDYSGTEYEVPVKTEVEEKPKKRGKAAKASTSRAKKLKKEDGESSKREQRVTVKMESDSDDWHVSIKNIVNIPRNRSEACKVPIGTPNPTECKKRCQTTKDLPKRLSEGKGLPFKLTKAKMITLMDKQTANINAILTYSNATPIRTRLDTGYACCFCDATYPDPADLKRHSIEHTDHTQVTKKVRSSKLLLKLDITALYCIVCEETTESLEILLQHLKDAHDTVVYDDVQNQVVPFKFHGETLQCHICCKSFTNFKLLLQHMNQHFKNYVCEICGDGFLNQMSFNNHKRTHQIGRHRCNRCSQKFDTLQKKKLHERNDHKLERRYKCGYCSEKFTSHRRKVMHLTEKHGFVPKTFNCHVCGKQFEGKFLMDSHVRRVHMMEKSHACELCNMSFFNKRELDQHAVKHSGVREFKCDICSKTFARKKTLRQHMRIHENDRRFKCDHCNQSYVQKRDWKRHMLSVHGEDN